MRRIQMIVILLLLIMDIVLVNYVFDSLMCDFSLVSGHGCKADDFKCEVKEEEPCIEYEYQNTAKNDAMNILKESYSIFDKNSNSDRPACESEPEEKTENNNKNDLEKEIPENRKNNNTICGYSIDEITNNGIFPAFKDISMADKLAGIAVINKLSSETINSIIDIISDGVTYDKIESVKKIIKNDLTEEDMKKVERLMQKNNEILKSFVNEILKSFVNEVEK